MLALFQKSGGFEKYWHFPEKQADLKNIGAFQKNRQIYKMLALFQKSGRFPKFRRISKVQALAENQAVFLFRLSGIPSC